ncbi:hypothetical protein D1815_17040 [Aquimarina sp. AD1]|uniref:hypothetical protein n=1 Tax=Aquimarina sp. (strain AD1) TaxID=1714848 RepID=UPI000E4ECCBA|nr:hypothetical protein [Aquimarina sp. AD1]AXT57366.1 hypothetical protein D1815_17040 [Aquimarina sp. AD1]RKN11202.1 hypothetical protein D7035_19165 [Aquimarina sp. AD1]
MSKLTKEQIKFIEEYLISNKVKYWDIRIELLDHIICEVEQRLQHNISFETAMEQIHKSFGNKVSFYAWDIGVNKSGKSIYEDSRGYKKLLIEKRKHITKKIRRTNLEVAKETLRDYKVMIPFLVAVGLIFSFAEGIGWKMMFLGSVILMLIPCIFVWADQYKKRKNQSLNLVVYSGWLGLMIYFPNFLNIFKQIDPNIIHTDIFLYSYTLFTLIAVFFTFVNFRGYQKMEKEYSQHYKLLSES